ncbi:MAG: imidazole glycerol phosphate synthase subunit HisH [Alphaproteobacteria bacterium]
MTIAVIDYGSGNLHSAAKAIELAARENGETVSVTSDANALKDAKRIVLPGVGAFADCKRGLTSLPGMIEALDKEVIKNGKPFLGICVGMQLMAERGLEDGVHEGLGWIKGEVRKLTPSDPTLKIPHMGWNDLQMTSKRHPLFKGLEPGSDAYFVHSYHLVCKNERDVLAETDYGGSVAAVIGRDNMAGTQFHPEKSQAVGLTLIANFLAWNP